MRILLPSLLILANAACAPTAREVQQQAAFEAGDRAALDRELAGRTPGRPQDCVQQTRLRDMKSFGGTLVYRGDGNVRYVNVTGGGCERVSSDDAFLVTATPSTSLCRGDIATAISRTSNFPIGSCSYGPFVPYRAAR